MSDNMSDIMSDNMSNNIGYIPINNYIIKIKVLDDIDIFYTYLKSITLNNMRHETQHYEIIQIINYLDDTELDEIIYHIDEACYRIYESFSYDTDNKWTKYYKKNNIYTERRYYYKTCERALSNIFMKYKLYNKYPNGYSGDYISYYPSGLIKEKYFHINGLIEGLYVRYYNDYGNSIEMQIEYVNGKKHGFAKEYNGGINIIENYNMDKRDGLCIYNNLGRCSKKYKVEITYKNGIIDGIYKKYFEYKKGGGLHIECNIKDGKYFGFYKEYNLDGTLLSECDYKVYNREIDTQDLM